MHTNFQDALHPPCNVAGNFKIFNATDGAYMMISKKMSTSHHKRPEPILDDFYSLNFSTLTDQNFPLIRYQATGAIRPYPLRKIRFREDGLKSHNYQLVRLLF